MEFTNVERLREGATEVELEQQKLTKLLAVFNRLYSEAENTQLLLGVDEPMYLPADVDVSYNRIIFAHGFFASALHEISHWLVAGAQRRHLEDYGYWYEPDGRTAQQQAEFEKVEIKPQALEWILSRACGHQFHFSADNLEGGAVISCRFKTRVCAQAKLLIVQGLGLRTQLLVTALCHCFGQKAPRGEDFTV
ncbi:MAG: elongation factor P hydroxylase [Pseudomonadales bacterium]|nr:elongation factor P hydroxylase [Pseudomonadales bacterium]